MLFSALASFIYVAALVTKIAGGPVVSLDYSTFEGASTGGVEKFLGLPYAQSPVGDLRFRRPQPPLHVSGTTHVSDLVLSLASCLSD
jgi:hypothetical protein